MRSWYVSYDVKSLFTSVPVDEAYAEIEKVLQADTNRNGSGGSSETSETVHVHDEFQIQKQTLRTVGWFTDGVTSLASDCQH